MKSSIINDAISFILSLIVLSYSLYTLDLVSIIGCFMAVIIPMIIKIMTSNTPFPEIFKRPDGAIDCNLFNTGGACDHESGFPSGHVTLISYFCFYIYFNYNPLLMRYLYRGGYEDDVIENEKYYTMKRSFLLFLCIVPVIMMGYARYMKKCHNLVQVVAGAVTGYAISKFIIKLNKHEINEKEESLTKTV